MALRTHMPSYYFQGETTYDNGPGQLRKENPYDVTGGAQPQMQFSESGVYSNPGEITS